MCKIAFHCITNSRSQMGKRKLPKQSNTLENYFCCSPKLPKNSDRMQSNLCPTLQKSKTVNDRPTASSLSLPIPDSTSVCSVSVKISKEDEDESDRFDECATHDCEPNLDIATVNTSALLPSTMCNIINPKVETEITVPQQLNNLRFQPRFTSQKQPSDERYYLGYHSRFGYRPNSLMNFAGSNAEPSQRIVRIPREIQPQTQIDFRLGLNQQQVEAATSCADQPLCIQAGLCYAYFFHVLSKLMMSA